MAEEPEGHCRQVSKTLTMIRMNPSVICSVAIMWFTVAGSGVAANSPFAVSSKAGAVMEAHCFECHGQDTQKGDVSLYNLAAMDLEAR